MTTKEESSNTKSNDPRDSFFVQGRDRISEKAKTTNRNQFPNHKKTHQMSAWKPRYCAGAWQYKSDELICIIFNSINRGGGAVGLSVRLSSRRLGVQIRAVTDQSRKNRK